MNLSIPHRITIHIAIERSFWMTDIVTVEVQRLMPIIISRTGKSCCYSSMFQFQLGVEYTFDYLDVTHLKILIILKTWHKDSDFTLIIGNFAFTFK